MSANSRQVGGSHYKSEIQHWDFVVANELDYFQGQITKYVSRWRKKNGIADLEKAKHFLDKYIEIETNKLRLNVPIQTTWSEPKGITVPLTGKETLPFVGAPLNIARGEIPKVLKVTIGKPSSTGQENPFGFDAQEDI